MDVFADCEFRVRSYECGLDGTATLTSVCNYLQEAASLHAEALEFSKTNFVSAGENITWVLTRLRVKMNRYPRWEEHVVVRTFPRGCRRVTAYRDFLILSGNETLGVATSEWMTIDLATRKLVPVPALVRARVNDERAPVLGETPFSRLRWDCRETAGESAFVARRGDIDINGHVNNVHYIEWLIETLPDAAGAVADFEIAFKSETFAGEEVLASSVEVEPGVWAAHVASRDGNDHVVARLKTGGEASA